MTLTALELFIKLLKDFEGCKLTAYQCPAGVWTIGYGHTGKKIINGLKITQKQADEWLYEEALECLNNAIIYSPNLANESIEKHVAIADFIYNCGLEAYKQSTLKKYVDYGQWFKASKEVLKWDHAKGKKLEGLTRRRIRESDFLLM